MLAKHLLVAGFLLASSSAVEAVPITWNLSGVRFNDGGVLNGSFVFDADTGAYSNINLTSTAGRSFVGAVYSDPLPVSPGTNLVLMVVVDDSLPLPGQPVLALSWAAPLSNAGGVVPIKPVLLGLSRESIFVPPNSSQPIRGVTAGAVSSLSQPLPEPGAGMLGLLAAAGLSLRRRRPLAPGAVASQEVRAARSIS